MAGTHQHDPQARTRVLYVDASVGFGGAVKSLALTLRGLKGVDKFVLTSQDPEIVSTWFSSLPVESFRTFINYRTNERLRARLTHPALQWIAMKGFAVADVAETVRNTIRLVSMLRRLKIDLVHLNNGFLPLEVALAARWTGVPCVVHVRGFQTEPVTSRWVATVARVIAVSDAVAASLDGTRISRSSIVTIHDPVDVDLIEKSAGARDRIRSELGITEREIAVGIFGRVIPWKGQFEFAQALIPAMRSDPFIKAIIVGDESDGARTYLESIRKYVEEAGMTHRFILAGYHKNVEEYYAAMNIVVHASTSPEPFGMVVPEAMAARRPVIAADDGGPREVVEDGVDGLLFPSGNTEALTEAVLRLARDPELRESMAVAGHAKVLARLSIPTNAQSVSDVYKAVLSAKASATASVAVSSLSAP